MSNITPESVARAVELRGKVTQFARVAAEVKDFMVKLDPTTHLAASDRDAEWQRVHSYIADVLKDTHVLYAKLARLEGDFTGEESSKLERISEAVLTIGEELSAFSKAFYEGKYRMQESDVVYGDEGGAPMPAPAPEVEFPMGGEEVGGQEPPEAPEGEEEAPEGEEEAPEEQQD